MHGIHDNADGEGHPSGCGWFRIVMPLAELRNHGHHVTWKCGRPRDVTDCDVITGQRFDNPDVLPEWRRFRAHSRLVYEIDDDIWNVPPANWNAHRTYKWEYHRDAVETASAVADMVTVTTEPLAEIMRKFNPEVRVLPNQIPGHLLEWDKPEHDKVVAGWRGGASHALDVQVMAPAVRKVIRAAPHAAFHMVGTDFRPSIGLRDARYTDWVPIHKGDGYYRALQAFDINLAPLAGLAFNRSKSNISALEAAALGIPTIATDAEPYRDFIDDGVSGYLIRHRSGWAPRLRELVNDADAREEMGRAARKRAEAWTIQSGYRRWEAAYEELIR